MPKLHKKMMQKILRMIFYLKFVREEKLGIFLLSLSLCIIQCVMNKKINYPNGDCYEG